MDVLLELQGSKVSSIPTFIISYTNTHTHRLKRQRERENAIITVFLAPKVLEDSAEAADRGSRRAGERGSAAADIDRGSCRGSLGGGADTVSFDPLAPSFVFFVVEAVSTNCSEREGLRVSCECEERLTATRPIRGWWPLESSRGRLSRSSSTSY